MRAIYTETNDQTRNPCEQLGQRTNKKTELRNT